MASRTRRGVVHRRRLAACRVRRTALCAARARHQNDGTKHHQQNDSGKNPFRPGPRLGLRKAAGETMARERLGLFAVAWRRGSHPLHPRGQLGIPSRQLVFDLRQYATFVQCQRHDRFPASHCKAWMNLGIFRTTHGHTRRCSYPCGHGDWPQVPFPYPPTMCNPPIIGYRGDPSIRLDNWRPPGELTIVEGRSARDRHDSRTGVTPPPHPRPPASMSPRPSRCGRRRPQRPAPGRAPPVPPAPAAVRPTGARPPKGPARRRRRR